MRIIDKYEDFYDYLQYVYQDNTVTFDRTQSFVLTPQSMLNRLRTQAFRNYSDIGYFNFLLLQIGSRFWLCVIEVIELDKEEHPSNYRLHCIGHWTNYSKPRKLISLEFIKFDWKISHLLRGPDYYLLEARPYNEEYISQYVESRLIPAIDSNDYTSKSVICNQVKCVEDTGRTDSNWKVPILKDAGFSSCIQPLAVFLAFEEYFSLEKQSAERIESVGLTNTEKIENHGFDTKISFRGKAN